MVASDPGLPSSFTAVAFRHSSRGATVTYQVPKPKMSPDAACKKAQSSVARLEKALESMGTWWARGSLESTLDQSQGNVEIDQCRKFIARFAKRIKDRRECFNDRGLINREAPRFNHKIPG